jgi:hypothetical protein
MSGLLTINVNEHIETKGRFRYLSWAWAWTEVLKHDPLATWRVVMYGEAGKEHPCLWIGETAIVHTVVSIAGVQRECLLPVMDDRNNAIKNPDARKISDALMRCMTKAIAMHGIGLYVYAGEDLPIEADADQETHHVVASYDGISANDLGKLAARLVEMHEAGDEIGAIRVWNAPSSFREQAYGTAQDARKYVWGQLSEYSKLRTAIKANKPEAAK